MRIVTAREQVEMLAPWQRDCEQRTAMPTYYHYTHNPNFTPDPEKKPWDHFEKPPEDAWWEQPKRKTPGLYVSPDPNEWRRIDRLDGGRPHRVELEGPEADNEGEERGHFIPGDRLDQYTVKNITPNQFWADQKAENERWDEQQKYYSRLAVSQEERIRQTYDPAHIHLPPEIAAHYMTHKERSDPRQKEDIARNGIQRPVELVTDGTHGYLSEGYHRTQAAGELGIPVPTHVYRVKDTGGWGKPLEPHLKGWLDANPDAGFHMGGQS